MSYSKMMKWNRHHPKGGKAQYMGFNLLGNNERRKHIWLGSAWFEEGMEEKRAERIRQYDEETARMLKANPNLKLV